MRQNFLGNMSNVNIIWCISCKEGRRQKLDKKVVKDMKS